MALVGGEAKEKPPGGKSGGYARRKTQNHARNVTLSVYHPLDLLTISFVQWLVKWTVKKE